MTAEAWRSALQQRWREEYGERFTLQELEAALDEVVLFRRYGARIAGEALDVGEMPFPCLLPAAARERKP
jgi:hypothetical protein